MADITLVLFILGLLVLITVLKWWDHRHPL